MPALKSFKGSVLIERIIVTSRSYANRVRPEASSNVFNNMRSRSVLMSRAIEIPNHMYGTCLGQVKEGQVPQAGETNDEVGHIRKGVPWGHRALHNIFQAGIALDVNI